MVWYVLGHIEEKYLPNFLASGNVFSITTLNLLEKGKRDETHLRYFKLIFEH